MTANQIPVRSSTKGYRHEMVALQSRHRARRKIQLRIGMLSYQRMAAPHSGHRERGLTTDSCLGSREMQTFKKLPMSSPNRKAGNAASSKIIMIMSTGRVYGLKCHSLCEVWERKSGPKFYRLNTLHTKPGVGLKLKSPHASSPTRPVPARGPGCNRGG
jgi:hypothetical protein